MSTHQRRSAAQSPAIPAAVARPAVAAAETNSERLVTIPPSQEPASELLEPDPLDAVRGLFERRRSAARDAYEVVRTDHAESVLQSASEDVANLGPRSTPGALEYAPVGSVGAPGPVDPAHRIVGGVSPATADGTTGGTTYRSDPSRIGAVTQTTSTDTSGSSDIADPGGYARTTRREVLDLDAMDTHLRNVLSAHRDRLVAEQPTEPSRLADLQADRDAGFFDGDWLERERAIAADAERVQAIARLTNTLQQLEASRSLDRNARLAAIDGVARQHGVTVPTRLVVEHEDTDAQTLPAWSGGMRTSEHRLVQTRALDLAGGALPDRLPTETRTRVATESAGAQLFTETGVHHALTVSDDLSRADGTSRNATESRSTRLGVMAGGFGVTDRASAATTERDADGTERSHRSGSLAVHRGIVSGANGTGVGGGFDLSGERRNGDTRRADTRNGSVADGSDELTVADRGRRESGRLQGSGAVTAQGANGSLAATGTVGRGPLEASVTTGMNGAFELRVTPVAGTSDYDLVMVIRAGGSLGGGLTGSRSGGEARRSIGVTVSASASGGITYTHRLPLDEARRYLTAAQATAAGRSTPMATAPEFGVLARLRAARDQGTHAFDAYEAIGSSDSARQMAQGSSIEMTGTVGGSVGVNASATTGTIGAGAEASHTASRTRTVRVARTRVDGQDRVELTLSWGAAATNAGSVNATLGAVTGQVGASATQDRTDGVRIRLDPNAPDYAANFREVMACADASAANAVAVRLHGARTIDHTTSDTVSGSVGAAIPDVASAQLDVSQTRSLREQLTLDGAHTTGTFTGTETSRGALSFANLELLSHQQETTATAGIDESGELSADLTETETTGLATGVPVLGGLLNATWTHLAQFHLRESDLDVLVARAGDAGHWQTALHGATLLHLGGAWTAFRGAMLAPSPDPAWVAEDAGRAVKLARARALAAFVRDHGQDATDAIRAVLRGWGSTDDLDLGRNLDWPPSISWASAEFDRISGLVDNAPATFAGFRGSDRRTRLNDWDRDVRTHLWRVRDAVVTARDYTDESARLETQGQVELLIGRLAAARRNAPDALPSEVRRQSASHHAELAGAALAHGDIAGAGNNVQSMLLSAAASGLESVSQGITDATVALHLPTRAELDDRRTRHDALYAVLTTAHARESSLLWAAHGLVRGGDFRGGANAVDAMDGFYDRWIHDIVALRATLRADGIPESHWNISTGPGAHRNGGLEPNLEFRARILEWTNTYEGTGWGLFASDRAARAARWRARAASY